MDGFVTIPDVHVTFRKKLYTLSVGRYPMTGDICLLLMDDEDEIALKVSTTHPSVVLAHDEVLVKNYSENLGIDDAVQQAGVIGPMLRDDLFPVHKLLLSVPAARTSPNK